MAPTTDVMLIKKDLLFKEIDIIQESIRKYDDLSSNLKNWTVVTWAGAVGILLQKEHMSIYLPASGLLPILFLFLDAHIRKLQRSFIYRFIQISQFINSEKLDIALTTNDFSEIKLLDPRAWFTRKDDFDQFVSLRTTINFGSVSWLYISLAFLSVLFWVLSGR